MKQQHLPIIESAWAGWRIKLPLQIDPKDLVSDRSKGRATAELQKGEISLGRNHQVPIALATVTRTTFLITPFVQ
jgi:hypothetical protein